MSLRYSRYTPVGLLHVPIVVLCSFPYYPRRLSDSRMHLDAYVGLFRGSGDSPTRNAALRGNQSTRPGAIGRLADQKTRHMFRFMRFGPSPFPADQLDPVSGYSDQRAATHRSARRAKKRRAMSGLRSSRAAEHGCSRVEQLLFPGVCPHFEHCRARSLSPDASPGVGICF